MYSDGNAPTRGVAYSFSLWTLGVISLVLSLWPWVAVVGRTGQGQTDYVGISARQWLHWRIGRYSNSACILVRVDYSVYEVTNSTWKSQLLSAYPLLDMFYFSACFCLLSVCMKISLQTHTHTVLKNNGWTSGNFCANKYRVRSFLQSISQIVRAYGTCTYAVVMKRSVIPTCSALAEPAAKKQIVAYETYLKLCSDTSTKIFGQYCGSSVSTTQPRRWRRWWRSWNVRSVQGSELK